MAKTDIEVTNIAVDGISLRVDGLDYVLSYEDHPWFENADAKAVRAVTRPGPNHLRWPDLDVDLALDSLGDPLPTKAPAKPKKPAAQPKKAPAKPKKPAAKPKKPSRRS